MVFFYSHLFFPLFVYSQPLMKLQEGNVFSRVLGGKVPFDNYYPGCVEIY